MVGGRSALAHDERLLRFVFPERPGALMKFLSYMSPAGTSRCSTIATRAPTMDASSSACRCRKRITRPSGSSSKHWVILRRGNQQPVYDCFCSRSLLSARELPAPIPPCHPVLHPAAGDRHARAVGGVELGDAARKRRALPGRGLVGGIVACSRLRFSEPRWETLHCPHGGCRGLHHCDDDDDRRRP